MISMAIAAGLFACDSNGEEEVPTLTEEEAAEMVANSLTSEVFSLAVDLGSTGYQASSGRIEAKLDQSIPSCGETTTNSISKSYEGDFVTFSYSGNYENTLTCFREIPIGLESTFNSSSNSESKRITTSGSMTGNLEILLDQENLGNYLLNGTLSGTRRSKSKIERKKFI